MTPAELALIFLAGMAAGTVNAIVGAGSLITFPLLLLLGYPPLVANVSNGMGLVPGGVSGVFGYRRELRGQRARIMRYLPASALGGAGGALLLLILPASAFRAIVPALIFLALVLVVLQPHLPRLTARRGSSIGPGLTWLLIAAAGVYGGYFGAAQGVLLFGLLSIAIDDGLQRINALKNVLGVGVNLVASLGFLVLRAEVSWTAVGLLAFGSIIGGQLGAYVGRRLHPTVLRIAIVGCGLLAIARLLTS